ncbi:MAG: fasciclin domain-containing protein, partial [Oscillatoriales cyanobacterium]
MKNQNLPNWMKQLTGFAGVIGASALIGFPAWAHINSNTTVSNATPTQQVAENVKIAASPAPTASPKSTTSPAPTAATKDIVAIASGDA